MGSSMMFVVVAMSTLVLTHATIKDQSLLPCDFETDLCRYSNWIHNYKDYTVRKASTVLTGPPTDHTLKSGDGHYAYISGSGYVKADLDHVNITITSNSCLSFWFYLSNDTVTYVDAYLVSDAYYKTLYYYDDGAGRNEQWIHGYADLPPWRDVLVYFRGQLDDYDASKYHYIALDDIEVFGNSCADQFNSIT